MRPADRSAPGALLLLVLALPLGAGCGRDEQPDAYGNFETTEVVVSAEAAGQLLAFTPDDGERLDSGAMVGLVDTVQLSLQREQIAAQRGAGTSRANEVANNIKVLEAQREIAQRGYDRTLRLHQQQAATAQQLDQAEREFRVLGDQIEAARSQRAGAHHDVASSAAQIAQIEDRIRRSSIVNPRAGTVLTTYVEPGEYVQQGQPLYKLAKVDSMDLRAYVTEPQLALLKVGQAAQVTIDAGKDERKTLTGKVTWVSSEAEFTPTPVQTREERADLVYAIKIVVPNTDGQLKIGMPADVRFAAVTEASK
ncbi:MAG TPA: HlyD family efflux transporter periplasmic adaptor subunit [Gemmatimonadales bacterium]|nr:HlyD family efflux transporter periplasmic adaptor subunit [Gemmatimonadales bacterium]